VGKPFRLRESPQTDTFAGTKVEEKASVCLGRNDKFAELLAAEQI
jgi:hypothetical protein